MDTVTYTDTPTSKGNPLGIAVHVKRIIISIAHTTYTTYGDQESIRIDLQGISINLCAIIEASRVANSETSITDPRQYINSYTVRKTDTVCSQLWDAASLKRLPMIITKTSVIDAET